MSVAETTSVCRILVEENKGLKHWLTRNERSSVGRWRIILGLLSASLFILPATLRAAENNSKASGGLNKSPLGSEGLLETTAGLLLVLGVILALAWGVRRFARLPMAGKGLVNVLGGTALGSRERVVVVQVENTRLVLGVAPGRIQTLYVLDPVASDNSAFSRKLKAELPGAQK